MKYSATYHKQKGFTLIELLVVIAIIAILATFLVANFLGAQTRARDGQRKSDLRQIQAALELYRADQGEYPAQAALFDNSDITSPPYSIQNLCRQKIIVGSTVYMQSIPCDPITGNNYLYYVCSSKTRYTLRACLENTTDADAAKDAPAACGETVPSCNFATYKGPNYTVNNP